MLWEGILQQLELDHVVLCVCEAVARVKKFLKVLCKDWLKHLQLRMQFSRATLLESLKKFKFLNTFNICAFLFKMCIIS